MKRVDARGMKAEEMARNNGVKMAGVSMALAKWPAAENEA